MLELIPMPRPAEQSGMEHLLTNFWMGKGEVPVYLMTSPLLTSKRADLSSNADKSSCHHL
jgi:hypothetical protein